MVFADLGPQEKDAFFSLLDEYFASRPEILTKGNNNHNGQTALVPIAPSLSSSSSSAAASAASAASAAVRNAMVKRPEATAKFMTAGLKQFAGGNNNNNHSNDNNRTTTTGGGGGSNSNKGSGQGESAAEDSMAGRIAAAQAMFSGKRNPFSKPLNANKEPSPGSSPQPPPPPPPSSYGTSSSSSSSLPSSSILKSSSFAPPPVRRTPSSTPAPRFPPPPPASSPPPQVEQERGEWVEALYDYDSGEAGDLKVKEGQRILLVERTSDDWWTGELNGNKGLIPASYVKIL